MYTVLILYYSKNDSTKRIARAISRGIESVEGITASIRTVQSDHYNESDDALVSKEDLKSCSAMLIGSPTHFGNMASPLKKFLDTTTEEWFNNTLEGKLVAPSHPHQVYMVDNQNYIDKYDVAASSSWNDHWFSIFCTI